MSVKEMIKKEFDKLPENLLPEVFDFIQFLESKRERIMIAKASQDLSTASFQKYGTMKRTQFMTIYNLKDGFYMPRKR